MNFSLVNIYLCFIFVCVAQCSTENYNISSGPHDNTSLQLYQRTDNEFSQPNENGLRKQKIGSNTETEICSTCPEKSQKKLKKINKKKTNNSVKYRNRYNNVFQNISQENTGSYPKHTLSEKKKKRRKRRRKGKNIRSDPLEATPASVRNTDKNNTFFEDLVHFNNTIPYTGGTNLTEEKNFTMKITNDLQKKVVRTETNSTNLKKLNRCHKNNGGCSQICKPKGKKVCSCLEGYVLAKNRKKCIDINECRVRNGGCKDICRNILGAYYCDCFSGFRVADDSKSCNDINECHLRNGHGPCEDTCRNTYGSYICDCSHLNGTRLGDDKHSCEDINECEETRHGCSHKCINTRVGAFCSCPEGMELMSDYKTCQEFLNLLLLFHNNNARKNRKVTLRIHVTDIDECDDQSVSSLCKVGCVNTIGSYYCEDEFQNDQILNKSKVPSCPPLNPPKYGYIKCIRNSTLPYDTLTKSGRPIIRNGPGTKCQLRCPIGFKLVGGGRFICGLSGKWIVKKKGACIKSSYPNLECPPNQTVTLPKKRKKTTVYFDRPRTDVRWKIVKSYPKWAKLLKGELGEGHHSIQFSVTDTASKLSSSCSFIITVKK